MARRVFTRPKGRRDLVRNRSSRRGARPRIVVIHTTESHERPGRSDVDAIHSWFDNERSQASSHVIVDAEGHSTTCVPDFDKAWTQASFNPQALSIELIGWASTSRFQWFKKDRQLRKAAKFTAYWCREYGIPVKRSTSHGICGHVHLGAGGGGHHDPGPNFPWDRFMRYVRYYAKKGWVQ
jgi:N-acetyl-anhydromuramyl-L-alanine amidase AmpD